MKELIQQQISNLEMKIESEQMWLDSRVAELKESVQKYDAFSIGTFVPGMVNAINESRQRLAALNEQLRMLVWMLKEGQKTMDKEGLK